MKIIKTYENYTKPVEDKVLFIVKALATNMFNKVEKILTDGKWEHPYIKISFIRKKWFRDNNVGYGKTAIHALWFSKLKTDEEILDELNQMNIKKISDIESMAIAFEVLFDIKDQEKPDENKYVDMFYTKYYNRKNKLQIAEDIKPLIDELKGLSKDNTVVVKHNYEKDNMTRSYNIRMTMDLPDVSKDTLSVLHDINEDFKPSGNLYWELSSEAIIIIRSILDLYNIKYTERDFTDDHDIDGKYNYENNYAFDLYEMNLTIDLMAGENMEDANYYYDGSSAYALVFDDDINTDGEFISNGRDLMDTLQKRGANMYHIMKQVNEKNYRKYK